VLHEEEDEVEMQSPMPPSPTGHLCAAYLLADGRWSSKFGGRVEDGVEIDYGERREMSESFPPPFFAFL
jgi:hypothetical protein